MTFLVLATLAGVLVGLSRQLNGRLSLSTSPLTASFWNHAVGFGALTLLGLVVGGLLVPGARLAPWWSYLGGPVGVVFVAAGSWVIARLGAARTALLMIAGQMVSGVALDWATGRPLRLWAAMLGVALILAGAALTRRPRPSTSVAPRDA
ncbi:DMT family transporter [Aureimonas sp. AU4]|uniref:DMT family transporter n=1 Tax=Aureimonas sp. AU4 TaxID=1638163 RepID=UPI000784F0BF|nr:DMT family transporter [Aureimonas sp. AU4]